MGPLTSFSSKYNSCKFDKFDNDKGNVPERKFLYRASPAGGTNHHTKMCQPTFSTSNHCPSIRHSNQEKYTYLNFARIPNYLVWFPLADSSQGQDTLVESTNPIPSESSRKGYCWTIRLVLIMRVTITVLTVRDKEHRQNSSRTFT